MVWIFLEISTFSFIVMLKNKKYSESLLKYFLVSVLSSILILYSISSENWNLSYKMYQNETTVLCNLMVVGLLIKMGASPFHAWLPILSESIDWKCLFILLTIMKLAPIYLISSFNTPIIILTIVMSSLLGTMPQMKCPNMKILLSLSSISHLSWMLYAILLGNKIFFIYFTIYSSILSMFIYMLYTMNILYTSNTSWSPSMTIALLMLGGIPPSVGFFPKWLCIMFTPTHEGNILLIIFMLMMSSISLYIYMRISTYHILNFKNSLMNKMPFFFTNMKIITLNILSTSIILFF